MAVPVVASFTVADTGGVTATNINLTKPTGSVNDDLFILIVGSDDASSNADEWNPPTGWSTASVGGGAASDAHFGVFYKVVSGTDEPDPINVTHDSADELYGWWIHVTGNDTTTPLNVAGTAVETVSSTTHLIAEVTTTVNDCLAFYVLAFDGGDGAPFSVSVGGPDWSESDERTSGTGANDASGTWGTKIITTAGLTGDVTIASTASDTTAVVQFAIAPPAAPDTSGDQEFVFGVFRSLEERGIGSYGF